jgi:hypothetical protein
MTKIQNATNTLRDFLANHPGEWTVDSLFREIGNLDDLLPHHIRRAARRLPLGCVNRKGGRLILSARHFAPKEEIIETLQSLPNWEFDLPVLIERHLKSIRENLVLADAWALDQSLRWASHGHFEIGFSYYGQFVRWSEQP